MKRENQRFVAEICGRRILSEETLGKLIFLMLTLAEQNCKKLTCKKLTSHMQIYKMLTLAELILHKLIFLMLTLAEQNCKKLTCKKLTSHMQIYKMLTL